MLPVLLTALGVGGATAFGAIIGFLFKNIPHKMNDYLLGFAAGVMLSASVFGLIMPSIEFGTIIITVIGIICGAVFLNFIDRFTPHLHNVVGVDKESHPSNMDKLNRILLFVAAIAIHNFPEGIAAGVSFGTGNIADAITVATGIALQNIPEGMIIIAPMVAAGISRKRTLAIAMATGFVEVIGTLFGYFAIKIASFILPFALAFAAGTMLYVISDEMIPETHAHGHESGATYALLAGFCVMMLMDYYIQ